MPVRSLAVAKNAAGATFIYAGCYLAPIPGESSVFVSTNAGAKWTDLDTNTREYVARYYVFDGRRVAAAGNKVYVLRWQGWWPVFGAGWPGVSYVWQALALQVEVIDCQLDPFRFTPTELAEPENYEANRLSPLLSFGPIQSDVYVEQEDHLKRLRPPDTQFSDLGVIWWQGNSFVTAGGSIFVASPVAGVVKSADDGHTWTSANTGMSNSNVVAIVLAPTSAGGENLIASTSLVGPVNGQGKVYCSTDKGSTWSITGNMPVSAMRLMTDDRGANIVLAATQDKFYRSTDAGLSWVQANSDGIGSDVGFTVIGRNVFTTHGSAVYKSTDYGTSWTSASQGVNFVGNYGGKIFGIGTGEVTSAGTSLFLAGGSYLYRSTDNGVSWHQVGCGPGPINDEGLPCWPVETGARYAVCGSVLFGSDEYGVRRSTDDGDTWTSVGNGGPSCHRVRDLVVCGSRIFVATDSNGVFLSTDNGDTWNSLYSGLPTGRTSCLASSTESLFLGTADRGVLLYTGSVTIPATLVPSTTGVVVAGIPFWVEVMIGDPKPVTNLKSISFRLSSNLTTCTYVDGTATYGTFLAQEGESRVPTAHYSKPNAQTVSIQLTSNTKMGSSGSGVVAKAQFVALAEQISERGPVERIPKRDITFSLSNVSATDPDRNTIEVAPQTLKVHISVGGGQVWPGDCNNDGVVDAADILPIGVYYGQALGMSNKPGLLWQGYLREGWPSDTAKKKLFADANGDGLINSVDVLAVGLNYGKKHTVGGVGKVGVSQALVDGALELGTPQERVSERGIVHISLLLKSSRPVYGVAFRVMYGVEPTGSPQNVRLIGVDTAASTFGGGLMLSRVLEDQSGADVGMTKTQGRGFAGEGRIMDLALQVPDGAHYWIEVGNIVSNDEKGSVLNVVGSTFRSDVTGGVDGAVIPKENSLVQNYPNPFNPSTVIQFKLSAPSTVTLTIFDILGRVVQELLDERRAAGTYSIKWAASGQSSGIYYYRMTARNDAGQLFTQSKRMILVK